MCNFNLFPLDAQLFQLSITLLIYYRIIHSIFVATLHSPIFIVVGSTYRHFYRRMGYNNSMQQFNHFTLLLLLIPINLIKSLQPLSTNYYLICIDYYSSNKRKSTNRQKHKTIHQTIIIDH